MAEEQYPSSLNKQETQTLTEVYGTWRYSHDPREHGFFLAKRTYRSSHDEHDDEEPPDTPGRTWVVGALRDFDEGFFDGVEPEDRFVAFVDPSTYAKHPGWMLRNYLVLIRRRFKLNKVQILCYRDSHATRDVPKSLILTLKVDTSVEENNDDMTMPKITGWERTRNGRLAPKVTDLGHYMDPRNLADQSVDLNLKLMKWRIAPDLNLERIKNTKCLLLGAGTLGSYVSRNLMGWGVRKITFVDNANVSFSNPVRQPLFDFKDCLQGGVKKAERAAEMLQEIYPGVDSQGHVISVPMLGHPIMDEPLTRKHFDTLQALIAEHDVIFLLMDTRESRWLPTLMGKAAGKIVLNAALGFDTYVVMRHGAYDGKDAQSELGCYFCNDVVAPADVSLFSFPIASD